MKRLLIGVIRVYQRAISPFKRTPTCRFAPTCSQYTAEAIQSRGVVVGMAKGLWRILRCNPFGGRGFDPVDAPALLPDGDRKQ